MKRWLLPVIALAALPAPAYYHFITYLNGVAVPEKYDLTALPNNTVTFFVSEAGPTSFNSTDTFNSVLSQIQQAAQVWNGVGQSAIRVAFGGLENASTPQNTPAADVVFEDLPPGLYGYGGPTSTLAPVTPANGAPFIPVTRSTVHLNRNLTIVPNDGAGPSYTATFFMTVVHEMGHALGLQHTFTSATMSQATTRATTLSHPLDADDIAGLAVLYPTSSFAQYGTISGQITSGGKPLHLTSVVALPVRPGWGAISALTNPDGTFQMKGVPQGQYYVYAHTLPPDANILGPWNSDGTAVAASGPTSALFYPGTTDATSARPISVQAGQTFSGVNISLPAKPSVEIYDVQIFGYFNYNNTYYAVYPANLDMLAAQAYAVNAQGPGLGASGLKVQIVGGQSYTYGISAPAANGALSYVTLDVAFNLGATSGPQHLVFSTPSYTYIAPAGITLTQSLPPTVTAATQNTDGTVSVSGANWASDSLIYFDGLPATISSIDARKGTAVVTPPPGPSGQTSVVTVYNSDGQNSQFLQLSSPVTYTYGNAATPAISSISPSALPAGAEAVVDITGAGFNFVPGQVNVGFGTSDIVVRRTFVLSPTHLQVDVSVSPNAALSNPDVSVMSGFQLATTTAGFQINASVPGLPAAIPVLPNAGPGLTGSYPGALVSLYGSNLAAGTATPVITIGGQKAPVIYASASQINLQIPAGLQAGPAVLTLNNGVTNAYPLTLNIDTLPASVVSVQTSNGTAITATAPARQGDSVLITLTNFSPNPNGVAQVSVNGAMHTATLVGPAAGGAYQISFVLNPNESVGASLPLIVYLDGRSSYPSALAVATPAGTFVAAQGETP